MVHRNALSALKGDLTLSMPFGDLQTTNEAIMDNNPLRAVLAGFLDLIDLDLFNEFTKDHGVKRFRLHKTPYCFEKITIYPISRDRRKQHQSP